MTTAMQQKQTTAPAGAAALAAELRGKIGQGTHRRAIHLAEVIRMALREQQAPGSVER